MKDISVSCKSAKMLDGPLSYAVLSKWLLPHEKAICWIALSGGMDSTVLFDLAVRARDNGWLLPKQLHAIHVNHHLSPHADAWQFAVATLCQDHHVALITESVTITGKHNIEAQARTLRYAAFKKHMRPGDILMTAHHQRDQAETVLLNLLRGAGLEGLAAIPIKQTFANGLLIRPLIHHTYEDLSEYANASGLVYINDESNESLAFDRNFLRHQIMPQLRTRWPHCEKKLARTAEHCQSAVSAFSKLYENLIVQAVDAKNPVRLFLPACRQAEHFAQQYAIRAWIKKAVGVYPSQAILMQLCQQLLHAKADSQIQVQLENVTIRRYREYAFVISPGQLLKKSACFIPEEGGGIAAHFFEKNHQLVIRYREIGDGLKKIFQMGNIPPWERDLIPIIEIDGSVAAVGDFWINHNYSATKEQQGFRVSYEDGHTVSELRHS